MQRLARLLVRTIARLLVIVLWRLRLAWARMSGRTRVAVVLVGLVLVAIQTQSILPSVSEAAQAFAVLLVAGIGFWMIVSSPVRRRPW